MARRFLFIRKSKPYQYLKDKFLYAKAFIFYKLNPYPTEIGENPIFIFNHIPKCGGTSLNQIFRSWFYLRKDYLPNEIQFHNPNDLFIELENFEQAIPDLNNVRPWEILAGHYHKENFKLSNRFLDLYNNRKINLITFVREPLSHHLSMYKFGKKTGHDFVKGLTLEKYLKNDENIISGAMECTLENYRQKIDKYFFIGIMEQYELSIDKLTKKLNRSKFKRIPYLNITESKNLIDALSKDEIEDFKKRNSIDYLVYNYVLEKFNSDVV